jgi:hypothetical protein
MVRFHTISKDGKLRENQLGIWDDSFIDGLSIITSMITPQNNII